MTTIKLESSDNKIFDVDIKVVQQSITLKTILETNEKEDSILLPNIRSSILEKFIEWANQHKDDLQDEKSEHKTDVVIPQWDQDFLRVNEAIIFDLTEAADYLKIKLLHDIAQKTVAIKGEMLKAAQKTPAIEEHLDTTEDDTGATILASQFMTDS